MLKRLIMGKKQEERIEERSEGGGARWICMATAWWWKAEAREVE